MFRLSVSVLSSSRWFPYQGLSLASFPNQASVTLVPHHHQPSYLLCIGDWSGTVTEYSARIGHLQEGNESIGKLRDNSVIHASVDADLFVSTQSLQSAPESFGCCHYKQSNNPTGSGYVATGGPIQWGQPGCDYNFTSPAYTYVYGGATRNVSPGTVHCSWRFAGNKALMITICEHPVVTYQGVKVADASFGTRTSIRKFRRSGVYLYFMGETLGTSVPTSSDESAAFGSIGTTGGSSVGAANVSKVSNSTSAADFDALVALATAYHSSADLGLDQHPVDFGDLAVDCAKQMNYVDGSLFSCFFDLAQWNSYADTVSVIRKGTFFKVWAGFKWGNEEQLLRALQNNANQYLFGQYAILPNVRDVQALYEGLKKLTREWVTRVHSRRSSSIATSTGSVEYTAVLTVETAKYPKSFTDQVQRLIGGIKKWGLWPDLSNGWDAVQYSFILNWFYSVGTFFKQTDAWWDVKHYFPAHHCVCSEKWVQYVAATDMFPGFSGTGTVQVKLYNRWITSEVPLPNISAPSMSQPFGNHWAEGSGLYAQRNMFLRMGKKGYNPGD